VLTLLPTPARGSGVPCARPTAHVGGAAPRVAIAVVRSGH
jgi:hypothetical protein